MYRWKHGALKLWNTAYPPRPAPTPLRVSVALRAETPARSCHGALPSSFPCPFPSLPPLAETPRLSADRHQGNLTAPSPWRGCWGPGRRRGCCRSPTWRGQAGAAVPGRRLCPCGGAPTVPGSGVPAAAAKAPVTVPVTVPVTAPRPGPSRARPAAPTCHGPPKMAAPEVKLRVGWPWDGDRDEGGAAAAGAGGAELMPEPDGAGRGRGGVREGPVPGLAKGWP